MAPRSRSSAPPSTSGRRTTSTAGSGELTMTSATLLDDLSPRAEDQPRAISPGLTTGDKIFRRSVAAVGATVLVITGAIGLFLGYQSIPTLKRYGWNFFVENQWQPENDILGISSVLLGTLQVALLALLMA